VAFDFEELDHLAAGLLETGMAPAAAVALTTPETTLFARTYGAASPAALWPIGSIGKSFTAAIALRLGEQGLLDLHTPVTDYVSWLSVRGRCLRRASQR
jgi:CubicO group peptidase (beta-lactamase class C family)